MLSLENLMLFILISNVLIVTATLIIVMRMYMRHSAIKRFYKAALTFSNGRTLPSNKIPDKFIIRGESGNLRYDLPAITEWLLDNNFKDTIRTGLSNEATNFFPILVPEVNPKVPDIIVWNHVAEPGIYIEPKWKQ